MNSSRPGLLSRYRSFPFYLRVAILQVFTTIPMLLSLTVFLPAGAAGIAHMGIVIFAAAILFCGAAFLEKSYAANTLLVLAFWLSFSVVHMLDLGSAPGRADRLFDGLAWLSVCGFIHLAIQLLTSKVFRFLTQEPV